VSTNSGMVDRLSFSTSGCYLMDLGVWLLCMSFFFLSSLLLGVVVRIRKTTTPKEKTKKKKTNNEMKEM